MTYRWVISHIKELPEDSRWVKHHRQELNLTWTLADHHRQDMVDLLQSILYFTSVGVQIDLSKPGSWQKVMKRAPQRTPRPGDPEPEKPKFASKAELNQLFGRKG